MCAYLKPCSRVKRGSAMSRRNCCFGPSFFFSSLRNASPSSIRRDPRRVRTVRRSRRLSLFEARPPVLRHAHTCLRHHLVGGEKGGKGGEKGAISALRCSSPRACTQSRGDRSPESPPHWRHADALNRAATDPPLPAPHLPSTLPPYLPWARAARPCRASR